MKVTIDEARVGKQPILKIDGIELANIVNGYTLHHDAGQPATLELRIAFGADLSEIEALIENPNVKIIMPEEEPHVEKHLTASFRRLFAAFLSLSTMWSGSRDTSSPGGCASSSGAQHRQTHRRTSSGASSPS